MARVLLLPSNDMSSRDCQTDARDIGQVTTSEFESAVNSEFSVDLRYCGLAEDASPLCREGIYPDGAKLDLKLVEVTRNETLTPHTRQDPCTLLFCGSHDLSLFSDVHVLEHPEIGRICVYLNMVNAEPGIAPEVHPQGRFYEAVIG